MIRFWHVFWVILLWAGMAAAESARVVVREPGLIALMQRLPDATLKRLQQKPEKFLTEAAALILGYGAGDAIDPAGLERYIALVRAEARARAMQRLLAADLDNDGVVTAEETAALAAAASARERGRLRQGQLAADVDGDGAVTMEELRAAGQLAALDRLSEADAEVLRGFMACDLDGDGRVSLAEVREVTRLLAVEI